ncbi:MAG: dienelactone hydrolase family protein [Roseiflexaceae bacterium]
MADIVLFHHAHGLTTGVIAFADQLRHAGHTVHTPDLFAGQTFTDITDGVQYVDHIGTMTIIARCAQAVHDLPADIVYAGFSLGVIPAQYLAQTRTGARGAILMHACVPYTTFTPQWPQGVPVQIHGMDADPFFVGEGDIDAAHALVTHAAAQLYLYPGTGHLFADTTCADYDGVAATLLMQRVGAFLG